MNRRRPARCTSALAGSTSDLGPLLVLGANRPRGILSASRVGGGRPSPGAQHQPGLRNKSRRRNILPVGKGPGVRGAAGGRRGTRTGPRPGGNAAGWTDGCGWGARVPGEAPASPGGKALEAKRYLPPPSCVPRGLSPHTPTSGGSRAFVGWECQSTPNRQPPAPPSSLRCWKDAPTLISPSEAPRGSGTIVPGPRPRPDEHPQQGAERQPADLHMQMRRGGGGEATRGPPPSVPSGRGADPAASCHGACSFVPPFEESKQTRL